MTIARSLFAFVFINTIYIGLPVMAWGFDDVPGFFASPARTAYAITGFVLALIAAGFRLRSSGFGDQKDDPVKKIRRQTVVLQLVRVVAVIAEHRHRPARERAVARHQHHVAGDQRGRHRARRDAKRLEGDGRDRQRGEHAEHHGALAQPKT